MNVYSEDFIGRLRLDIKDKLYFLYKDKKKVKDICSYLDSVINLPFNEFEVAMLNTIDPYNKIPFEYKGLLINNYEVYWDCINSLTFYCDLDKNRFSTDKLKKDNIISLLEKMLNSFDTECVIVNGCKKGFKPFMIRLSKIRFKLGLKKQGVLYNTYCFTISLQDDNGEDNSVSFYLIPELYPKVFVDTMSTICLKEDIHNDFEQGYKEITMLIRDDNNDDTLEKLLNLHEAKSFDIAVGETTKFLLAPYGVRNNETYSGKITDNIGMYFEQLLSMCFYCIDKYVNRRKIYNNSKNKRDVGVSAKVYIPNEENNRNTKFLSLNDIVIYEKRTKTSLGGHHASPREHIRKGYWRTYKNGKKVWINQTVVNKGKKGSTIYKV